MRTICYLISMIFLLAFESNAHTRIWISTDKITVTIPETIEERFFVQLFLMLPDYSHEDNTHWRLVKEASEVHKRAEKGEEIEIKPTLREKLLFSTKNIGRLYIRIIKVGSQTYQVYKVDKFSSKSEELIRFSDFSPVSSSWDRINFSRSFTFKVIEGNPQEGCDYKANVAQIKGLPNSYCSPIENNLAAGWFHRVKGIYYLDGDRDHYPINCFMKIQGKIHSYAGLRLNIQTLEEHNYKFNYETHYGD